ncbi:hypothetical protein CEK26_008444 [Fusarium fujikuroi]|uniref:Uncharacterized protein n=1 Tax=Fusarium fujikuroi TaxID=5127 RepID=A0A5Q3DD53_FUSFU|nr:hypothetical protein CEK27_008461 [Fusarium fujikuroi]QGI81749.1 hypothetical protein CEK25_008478 [Fusarium fujikuroi]QGI95375.1 hypothetical protein CEK26_008444 [Fusarium fujikuroi]VTT71523.1 unnamed protein product [Fusarium fujikuroi]VTT71574.1 unnamed protein product [Fusarium fujikuroi]
MIRLYILLWLLPCLFLTTPLTHAALLPRLKASFRLPGVVFSEPVARSFKVVPFKEIPGEAHHGHGLRQTLGLVKRLVEDQGDMVAVTEEALQELLDQINKLHEQVNSMMPSGATDKQPTLGTGTSSGGQSGQSDQLPAGSSDESTGSEQSEEPAPSGKASVSRPGVASDPSEAPVVSDPSLRSPLLSQADVATIVESQAPGAPAQLHASQIDTGRQAKTDLAQPAANPTQVINGESTNSKPEAERLSGNSAAVTLPEGAGASGKGDVVKSGGRSKNAVAQPTGEIQASMGTQLSTAQDVKPTEEGKAKDPRISSAKQAPEASSTAPGEAFVENPDNVVQTVTTNVSFGGQTSTSATKETQRPSGAKDDDRNPNCTPGGRIESASEPAQDTTITVVLVPTPEEDPSKASATESWTQITEDSPATAKAEGAAPALETEATSTPDINAGDSQQLAAPTLLSNPSAVSAPEPTALSLRTLVFTSVLTRSSTILVTTVRTEFVNANQPTASLKAPGHVFKEDEDTGTNAAFNKGGKLALEGSVNEESTPGTNIHNQDRLENSTNHLIETLRGTPLALETKAILTTTTTTISLSHVDVMTTPEPSQEARSISSPSSHDAGGINETFHATPNSGFRTIPRSSASLAERA